MYRLQVTKFVKNEGFEKEMEEYRERTKYGYGMDVQHPVDSREERRLEVELTDEEYNAVKESVLKCFK